MTTTALCKRFLAAAIFLGLAVFAARPQAETPNASSVRICHLGQDCYTVDPPANLTAENACELMTNELTIEILDGGWVACGAEYGNWETLESTIEILD